MAQGSPSQASIPSVIRITIFLQFEQGVKSLIVASKDFAIGVVPLGYVDFKTVFIYMCMDL